MDFTGLLEKILLQWGPLGLGWLVAGALAFVLHKLVHMHIAVLKSGAQVGEGWTLVVESLESSFLTEIGRLGKKVDRLAESSDETNRILEAARRPRQ